MNTTNQLEVPPMTREGRVAPVHAVSDGMDFSGWGFVIRDDDGIARLTLSYLNQREAEDGHAHIVAAFAKAAVVSGPP